ncbi:pilus assembly protein TadG-related protein [Microbacterium dauci]|uniref:Pilus assembly protein TadG-related protein n=1 Tax=Microbacterium dauci TaxID=3048008 RepID=A0ABT6ZBK8_9MICO|nr:pilus assembly protein TadG-related protein [Microbacterium sp. LX3-4]MDJ1113545.1 pilus assembly protein TadG-related protein [Microbacterium sp. LX3-4]
MRRLAVDDDDGSILLLTLGYALLALALVFVCVDATSLYLAQKRIQSTADAAALAGADGFTLQVEGGEPVAELTDAGVSEQATAIVAASGGAVVVDAETPDGVSARVTVATTWHPVIGTIFVPDGVRIEATATSRTALR